VLFWGDIGMLIFEKDMGNFQVSVENDHPIVDLGKPQDIVVLSTPTPQDIVCLFKKSDKYVFV